MRRLVVGVTGSSGPQLAEALLTLLADIPSVETHLVLSNGAPRAIDIELGTDGRARLEGLADVVHDASDVAAPIASGSFITVGMVVIPCSMRTLGAIASGVSDDLLTRAADVTLKERRTLVVVPRETPLSLIHIRNMETLTLAGATILPPVPAFYHRPSTIQDLLDHTAGKVLDRMGIDNQAFTRWHGPTRGTS